ncbi:site-specific integrase [Rhizobium rhizophilum]|uniref:integrase n=1 Tax=Rhizobium rhizophilum TaxID=1850373 RepID=UPI002E26B275
MAWTPPYCVIDPRNKGSLVGLKRPLQLKNVWSIRVRLVMGGAIRVLALFNLAIDSELRACYLVKLRVEDVWSGSSIRDRATIIQKRRAARAVRG